MKFLIFPVLLALAACSDTSSRTFLAIDFDDFEESESTSFTGDPGFVRARADTTGTLEPLAIRSGELLVTDSAVATGSLAQFVPNSGAATSLLYSWNGTFNALSVSQGARSFVSFSLVVPQPPRQPFTVARIDMETVATDTGPQIIVTALGSDEEIGVLRPGRAHSVLVVIDLETQTYRVSGGNFGDINSGELDLLASVRSGVVPQLVVNVGRGTSASAEYRVGSTQVVGFLPIDP